MLLIEVIPQLFPRGNDQKMEPVGPKNGFKIGPQKWGPEPRIVEEPYVQPKTGPRFGLFF